MSERETSLILSPGGTTTAVSLSTTSAQGPAIASGRCNLYATAGCFLRYGLNPTALSTGVDEYLPAGTLVACVIPPGMKIAAILGSGTGTLYITPKG